MFAFFNQRQKLKEENAQLKTELDELQIDISVQKFFVSEYRREISRLRVEVRRMNTPTQFNSEEIKSLIRLCHPDKHNNSDTATRMTQKLLGMRK